MNQQSNLERALAVFTPEGHLTINGAMRFVNGGLSEEKRAEVRTHLAQCPRDCKHETEALQRGVRARRAPLRLSNQD